MKQKESSKEEWAKFICTNWQRSEHNISKNNTIIYQKRIEQSITIVKRSCQPINVNVIQAYFRTMEVEDREIETYYAQLKQIVTKLRNNYCNGWFQHENGKRG